MRLNIKLYLAHNVICFCTYYDKLVLKFSCVCVSARSVFIPPSIQAPKIPFERNHNAVMNIQPLIKCN